MAAYEPKNISKTEAAYIAGIIDGEGSLCISQFGKTPKGVPMWQVTCGLSNTEEGLIDWFVEKFGGSKMLYTRNQMANNCRRQVFRWQCTGNRLRHLCEVALPYSVIKKRQFEIIVEMLDSFKERTYTKGQRGPSISQEVIDRRYKLLYELRSLHNRLSSLKHN